MAGRDHNATVKVIHSGDVSHRRGGSDMEQVGICTGSGQTGNQTILEPLRATAGIFTDYNAHRLVVAVALTQSVIIPA